MNVCLVTQQFFDSTSGVGVYANLLVRGFLRKGLDVEVLTADAPRGGPSGESPSGGGVEVPYHAVSVGFPDPSPNRWFSLAVAFRRELDRLAGAGKSYDIVHFADARESMLARKGRARLLGTQHDCLYPVYSSLESLKDYRRYFPWDWRKRFLYYRAAKAIERRAVRRLDTVITVSRFVGRRITEAYSLDPGHVHVVHNGYPSREAGATVPGFGERGNIILFVGGNFQRRNLMLVARALPLVREKVPGVELVVVGEDQFEDRVLEECRRLGVADRVRFLGRVPNEEVLEMYSSAKVFAMPSLYESCAFTFLEAMSRGLPVIGGSIGGASEQVRDGVEGFIVGPDDVRVLAERATLLLSSAGEWSEMSRRCVERVGHFTEERMVEETALVYEASLDGPERPSGSVI